MTPDEAIARIRALRGPRAIQSVKQYNLVHEYRQLQWQYHQDRRPISR